MSSFHARDLTLAANAITIVRSATFMVTPVDGTIQGTGPGGAIQITDYDASLRSLAPYVVRVAPAGGASSGTLDTISGLAEGDICVVMTLSGKTINIRHAIGNLRLADGDILPNATVVIQGRTQSLTVYHNGFELVELHRSFPPVI